MSMHASPLGLSSPWVLQAFACCVAQRPCSTYESDRFPLFCLAMAVVVTAFQIINATYCFSKLFGRHSPDAPLNGDTISLPACPLMQPGWLAVIFPPPMTALCSRGARAIRAQGGWLGHIRFDRFDRYFHRTLLPTLDLSGALCCGFDSPSYIVPECYFPTLAMSALRLSSWL